MKVFYTFFLTAVYLLNAQAINTELIGHLDPIPANAQRHYADIWGYVAPDSSEYALLDGYSGVYIINITDAANPYVVTFIPGPESIWRDIKVHERYAYFVSEAGNAGLQIVDLKELPDSAKLVKSYNSYFNTAHNIFIDNGYAYVVGSNAGGGMHILDLSDPLNPVETGYYSQSGYIHDVYVWNDTAVVSAGNSYDLVDLTDKTNPQKISGSGYIPEIYAHEGWMTEDKKYYFGTDEFNVRDIIVFDLSDRTNWQVAVPSYQLPNNAIVHNIFIKGNYAYCSYYEAGLVIFDISDPTHPLFAGQYDTYPTDNNSYNGAWGAYPFLPSGNIIVSDQSRGLFIVKFLGGDTAPGIIYSQSQNSISETSPQIISVQILDNSAVVEANLFFRTTKAGVTSEWNFITDTDGPDGDFNYNFVIPEQTSGTTVEYYFAASDDSGNVVTLPLGGSGTDPAGNLPPENLFAYTVVTSFPQIISVTPNVTDTTITKGDYISFSAVAEDTSGLDVKLRWFLNGTFKLQRTDYTYTSAFGSPPPRIDTVKLVATNGFNSVERLWFVHVEIPTGVEDDNIVDKYDMKQNFPNPFNPSTNIIFDVVKPGFVRLSVYNSLGQLIATLVNGNREKGRYTVEFNAANLPSGIYIYKIVTGNYSTSKKMLLMK